MTRSRFLRLVEYPFARRTQEEDTFFHVFLKHLLHHPYWLCDSDYIYLTRRFKVMIEDDPFHLFAAA
ncbi:MAG: hypothetical protein OXI94_20935 [Gemmatimonadota bacterium]|nr:hypothetical protein [Gemmatimonadota bacterium]